LAGGGLTSGKKCRGIPGGGDGDGDGDDGGKCA
jgi:hypothetical protein